MSEVLFEVTCKKCGKKIEITEKNAANYFQQYGWNSRGHANSIKKEVGEHGIVFVAEEEDFGPSLICACGNMAINPD